jgi:DNA primase
VAPLGTALTEEQVQLLWRLVPEPILCFDGDSAGRRAAHRAVDVILPHLKPGLSAGFAFLPDGLDPDDLVRQEGAHAMSAVLARARPLADVLWEREFNAGTWSTPERRARLEQQIAALVGRIVDPAVRAHYGSAMRERLYQAWGAARRSLQTSPGRWAGGDVRRLAQHVAKSPHRVATSTRRLPFPAEAQRPSASQSLRHSSMVEAEAGRPPYREALILRTLINHPWLMEHDAERIADLEFGSPAMARLRDALLSLLSDNISLDRAQIRSQLERSSLGKVFDLVERAITHRCDRFAEPDADATEVERGWRHTLALHERQTGLRRALAAAERTFHEEGSENALARIVEIKRQLASSDLCDLPTEG